MKLSLTELQKQVRQIRYQLVALSHDGKAPHLASSLSCVDLVLAAYSSFLQIDPNNPNHPARDRFILSKGHAITTLYSILAGRGFFWLNC